MVARLNAAAHFSHLIFLCLSGRTDRCRSPRIEHIIHIEERFKYIRLGLSRLSSPHLEAVAVDSALAHIILSNLYPVLVGRVCLRWHRNCSPCS